MSDDYKLERRGFLSGMAAASIAGACPLLAGSMAMAETGDGGELAALDVSGAARLIKDGDLLAEDYARALLARQARNRQLNAFISLDGDALLEAARGADKARAAGAPMGPLHGVPLAIKDNIETEALTTTSGTEALRNFRPGRNAPVVQRLLDAGALLMGKANMHELAIGATSNNATFGAVHNPYKFGYLPGGSSGGTAAAVAARISPAGLGSDTAGSVRTPAALCGVVGLRPATGRYPGAGMMPLSGLRDTVGPITRSVADAALLDAILSGQPAFPERRSLKGVRIGVPRSYFWENLDPETERVAGQALDMLRDAGALLVEAPMDDVLAIDAKMGLAVILYEAVRDMPRYLRDSGSGVSFEDLVAGIRTPNVRGFFEQAMKPGAISEAAYRDAVEVQRPALRRAYSDYFQTHDVAAVVVPTTPLPARPIEANDSVMHLGKMIYARVYLQNIGASSNAGLPTISVPAGLTKDGLPVGIEFDGPLGSEKSLFEIAAAFERAAPPLPPPPIE